MRTLAMTTGGRLRLAIALACLASGAGLIAYIATRVSLAVFVVLGLGAGGLLIGLAWHRADALVRSAILGRVRYGLMAGVAATLAYDLTRLLVVRLLSLHVGPFDALPLFGGAILGAGTAPDLTWAVGLGYHYLNGVSFAVGYCILLRFRPWPLGIGWALLLEAGMLLIYPGWLNLGALQDEFNVMSTSGHVAYGTVLGVLGQYLHRPGSRRGDARQG